MKTFRKSSLISSVALLLVAIVALSGATFAWFSANTSVTASKVEIKSTEASGIYIAGTATTPQAADWKSELEWTDSETLNPVSGAFVNLASPKFYSTSTDKADGTWNGAKVSTSTSYIVKDVWLKADKGGDLQVSFDFTGSEQQRDYQRVAFVDVTNTTKTLKVFANADGTTEAITAEAAEGATSLSTTTITNTAFGDTTLVEDWDGGVRHFQVYVYFEGQDAACTNTNSIADVNVSLTFAIAAPAQG